MSMFTKCLNITQYICCVENYPIVWKRFHETKVSLVSSFWQNTSTIQTIPRDLYYLIDTTNWRNSSLDDSDLVSDVQSIVVRSQAHVCLLVSGGTHQGVNLGDVDVVQLLDSALDLMLVGLDVTDEDQGVVILNLLHSWLSGKGVLNDVVSVHLVPLGGRLPGVLRGPDIKLNETAFVI